METWKIYMTTNLINGHTYIGQTKKEGRVLERYLGSGYYIKHAIHYYGVHNFIKQILHEGIQTKEQADCLEELEISKRHPDYNIAIRAGGGNLGEAWLQKLREKMRSSEYRAAMRRAQNDPRTRERKSLAMKAARTRGTSDWSTCNVLETSYIDRDKRRQEGLSVADKKRKTWSNQTAVQKQIISKKRAELSRGNKNSCKKVCCIQTGEIFLSIREAAARFGVSATNLGQCIRRAKPARCGPLKGLQFTYI